MMEQSMVDQMEMMKVEKKDLSTAEKKETKMDYLLVLQMEDDWDLQKAASTVRNSDNSTEKMMGTQMENSMVLMKDPMKVFQRENWMVEKKVPRKDSTTVDTKAATLEYHLVEPKANKTV